MAGVVDRMIEVPGAASLSAARWLARRTGRRFGPSTGTNLIGVVTLALKMRSRGERGSLATLACDGGERYADTIYDDDWLAAAGLAATPRNAALGALDQERNAPFAELRGAEAPRHRRDAERAAGWPSSHQDAVYVA
jgi:cysteine synthase A